MVPSIVVGAHPKRHEQEPIGFAIAISRLTHAPIDVVASYWFDTTPQRTAPDEYGRVLREEIEQKLDPGLNGPDGPGGEVRIHVMSGSVSHALQETASEAGAGLIIVGSTHRGAVGRITLGTTADRVLDHAPCPVVVVPRGFRDEGIAPRRVGVAFVDTEGGRSALRAGAAIAHCADASLIAYTVIEPHAHEADRNRAKVAVERAIADIGRGVHAEARVLTSGGVEALAAQSRELDFLVRGVRGRGPVRPPLAFGLPSKLAQRTACPFVIVPPGREEPLVALFDARAGAGHEEALSG